jgi:chromosome segregation ATPase
MKHESLSYWVPFVLFLLVPSKSYDELVTSIERSLLQAERRLTVLEKQLSEQSERTKSLSELSRTLQQQLSNSERLIQILEIQLTNSERRVESLQREVINLRRQHIALTNRYKRLSQEFENYESEIQKTLDRMTTERNILRGISGGLLILAVIGWAL